MKRILLLILLLLILAIKLAQITRVHNGSFPSSSMMMMTMMRRFVKSVLNSPQRRCQSIKQVALEMSGERQRRELCGSKGSWQTVPDAWAGDRKTPHPQCCRRPWHEKCPSVCRPKMSLAGDSGNCTTVVDQVSWRQSMQAFVYCHGELVLNPLANWQAMKVAEHRSDVVELSCARHHSSSCILNSL